MKVLGYILTAAAVLIGADIFVASSDPNAGDSTSFEQSPISLAGGSGIPPTPTP